MRIDALLLKIAPVLHSVGALQFRVKFSQRFDLEDDMFRSITSRYVLRLTQNFFDSLSDELLMRIYALLLKIAPVLHSELAF
jgi:hypothetical protein